MARKKTAKKTGTSLTGRFGEAFRARREALGLTLTEFARINGIDKGNLSKVERGLLPPPQDPAVLADYVRALKHDSDSAEARRFIELAAAETNRLVIAKPSTSKRVPRVRTVAGLTNQTSLSVSPNWHRVWMTERRIEQWADTWDAPSLLPIVIRRLIRATVRQPGLVRFSGGEGVQRHDWDGLVQTALGHEIVPEGHSGWELSVRKDVQQKANEDYAARTKALRPDEGRHLSFVYVTARKWDNAAKKKWRDEKLSEGKWLDVRVLDSSDLEQWLELAPAVDAWFAQRAGLKPKDVQDIETFWLNLRASTLPQLPPEVFLASREKEVGQFRAALGLPQKDEGNTNTTEPELNPSRPSVIAFEASNPRDVLDFVAAFIAGLSELERELIESRLVIVESLAAWRDLCATDLPLTLITHPKLLSESTDSEFMAEATRNGHQAIVCSERFLRTQSGVIELPNPRRADLEKLLETLDFGSRGEPREKARRIAEDCRRSLSALKRRLSVFPQPHRPDWAKDDDARQMIPFLLAGGWNDNNPKDLAVLASLGKQTPDEMLDRAARLRKMADSPLLKIGATWSLTSRDDSWLLLAENLTARDLDALEQAVLDVLGTVNPELQIPHEDRWRAALFGIVAVHSAELRQGLAESVALLATRSSEARVDDSLRPEDRSERIVHRLFSSVSSWKDWASLNDVLPLLAEAAPDVFLTTLETDLQQSEPASLGLFKESAGGQPMFGRCYHASLLWALETLAWAPTDVFGWTVAILADLAERSVVPGNWSNTAFRSLLHVFLPWCSQTGATIDQQEKALKRIVKRFPQTGWRLLVALLPDPHGICSDTHRPRWRNWAEDFGADSTPQITRDKEARYGAMIVPLIGTDPDRVKSVIDNIARFPDGLRGEVLQVLQSLDRESFTDEQRAEIVTALRTMITRHRRFETSAWAMPSAELEVLETVLSRFESQSLAKRIAWLFADSPDLPIAREKLSFDEKKTIVEQLCVAELRGLFAQSGVSGIRELLESAKSPYIVGRTAGISEIAIDHKAFIPSWLTASDERERVFARGLLSALFSIRGWGWIEAQTWDGWSSEQIGIFLAQLPVSNVDDRRVWNLLESLSAQTQRAYWSRCSAYQGVYSDAEDLKFAAESLVRYQRPLCALQLVQSAIDKSPVVETDLVFLVLDAVINAQSTVVEANVNLDGTFVRWGVGELIKYLQQQSSVDEARLAAMEFAFLGAFEHSETTPQTLIKMLSRDGTNFAQLIQGIYRSKTEVGSLNELSPELEAGRCAALQSLQRQWHEHLRLPGTQESGEIDADELSHWINIARERCRATGHLQVCDVEIGNLLAREQEPEADSNQWPSDAVKDVLEEINTPEVMSGFEMGAFNKVGIRTLGVTDDGDTERNIASKYDRYATASQDEWPLVARSLRHIADQYRELARHEDERAARIV